MPPTPPSPPTPWIDLPLDITSNILHRLGAVDIEQSAPLPTPWIDLPVDITSNILHRLGAVDILQTAQKVCTTWRRVCKDPAMWRVIDMHIDGHLRATNYDDFDEMCRHAVDRSQGQLVDINLEHFASNDLIGYIAARCGNLRRLRLFRCRRLSNKSLAEAIKGFPNLESLDISLTRDTLSSETIEMVGRCCPLLSLFALNEDDCGYSKNNEEAYAIARSMPGLRHLQLFKNDLTNKGLQAILDGCPYLESLVLGCCYLTDPNRAVKKGLSKQTIIINREALPILYFGDYDYTLSSDYEILEGFFL